jgi:hypothetical protein
MFLYWLLGGSLFGLVLQWFFKFWNTLDNDTKKLIIEAVIKAFEEILRAFYRWWKSREDK